MRIDKYGYISSFEQYNVAKVPDLASLYFQISLYTDTHLGIYYTSKMYRDLCEILLYEGI